MTCLPWLDTLTIGLPQPLTIGEAYLKIIMSSFLVLSDGDTRNRWHDGQVCPDVGQGTMTPWARRPGCVLACDAQMWL
ncbi:hypothetical protein TNCV_1391311 [Trichonephila clavipes]|nr:hypothetical protein TNCV_1391311 [Trichonephila clavipes]